MHESLQQFLPPIAQWFENRLGLPTPPQIQGWPQIAAGNSTLILAPTGSGKTLAAFLAAIDRLARDLLNPAEPLPRGVQILYISPLKALANDIEKNLTLPLAEIAEMAHKLKHPWPEIQIALRTGDTPQKTRAAIARKPPHLLITTPESFNLILTSAARQILRTTRYVIIDEVHSLAGNKRGVFLSILLERLEYLRRFGHGAARQASSAKESPAQPVRPLVRIGLSATARPETEIARWLGGYDNPSNPRPVQIVNTGQRKRLDLQVLCPWGTGGVEENENARSHWPAVTRELLQLIREHRSTLVFANSRRLVERLVKMLYEKIELQAALAPGQHPDHLIPRILPHHGSISKNVRLATEEALKRGELAAVVTTSSLELGIDIGQLDLVCQIDSPGTVAAALQRVGRAGHLEKATAKGRLIPRMVADLPALAAIIPLMYSGQVEEVRLPENCLDVLAQQIVAACVGGSWEVEELFCVFQRATAYRTLAEKQFLSVLNMLAPPRPASQEAAQSPAFRPRIAFDRVNDLLAPLPSSAQLATINAGVISDTGQFPVFITGTRTRLGELDEEFVFETREQERIVLGSQIWRVETIEPQRVTVSRAEGRGSAKMPFWRGESAPRSLEVGTAIANLSEQIEKDLKVRGPEAARQRLITDHHFDDPSADTLLDLFARQRASGSAMPTATRIVIEHFADNTGEPMIAVLSPLGGRVHHVLRLALESALAKKRLTVQIVHSDDGLLMRCTAETCEKITKLGHVLSLLTPENLETLVLNRLEDSALFGLHFRQNAARALLLPRPDPRKRTPLWQQRLRARNLLAQVRQRRNFPIVVETYRECLQDVLLVDRARELLADVAAGRVRVVVHSARVPSPLARSLWMNFEAAFLYQWDDPLQAETTTPTVDHTVLDSILQSQSGGSGAASITWGVEDLATLQRRMTGSDYPARNGEELLEKIAVAGAVPLGPPDDPSWQTWTLENPAPLLEELQNTHRLLCVGWPGDAGTVIESAGGRNWESERPYRWIATEMLAPYLAIMGSSPAFFQFVRESHPHSYSPEPLDKSALPPALLHFSGTRSEARELLLQLEFRRHPTRTLAQLQHELPFLAAELSRLLARAVKAGQLLELSDPLRPDARLFLTPDTADQLRTFALRRNRRAITTADLPALQSHLLRWHHINPPGPALTGGVVQSKTSSPRLQAAAFSLETLEDSLDQLSPLAFTPETWECDLLPLRVPGFARSLLDQLCASGRWVWVGYGSDMIAFIARPLLAHRPPHAETAQSPETQQLLAYLQKQGASFTLDLELALPGLSVSSALKELVAAGKISNDRLDSLHHLLATPAESVASTVMEHAPRHLPAYSHGSRLKSKHLGRHSWLRPSLSDLGGRWFLLPAPTIASDPLAIAQDAATRAERLLRRHGFACKELSVPAIDGPWRTNYEVLTRMEWALTVRRGYFVDGIAGAQFALPGTDLTDPHSPTFPVVWLSLLDPANLYAQTDEPWAPPPSLSSRESFRIPRVAGSWVALVDARPVLAATSHGSTLWPLTDNLELLSAALLALPQLLGRLPASGKRFLRVRRWMESDILGSPAESILRAAGFVGDPGGLRLYRKFP